jgi:2-oxoglutarate dehydrogenase E1 component
VLGDSSVQPEAVRRLVFCSGKIYYDIAGHEARDLAQNVAVARIELLYPFPLDWVTALVASYPNLVEIVWAQEEPQNMGAWRSLRHRLEEAAAHAPRVERVAYIGRPWRASPSEGYPTLHHRDQDRIVASARAGSGLLDARWRAVGGHGQPAAHSRVVQAGCLCDA